MAHNFNFPEFPPFMGGYKKTVLHEVFQTEGTLTQALGASSHAEGYGTRAGGDFSHAEGAKTVASGIGSHTEGIGTQANGAGSHAEGIDTEAVGPASHSQGARTIARGAGSHAEGKGVLAEGHFSHAEGEKTKATGTASHAEGSITTASGYASHAEGVRTAATGVGSHAGGAGTIASAFGAYAEGVFTKSDGYASHAEGEKTSTGGHERTHIMGLNGQATEDNSWFLANNGIVASINGNTGRGSFTGGITVGPYDFAVMFETVCSQPIEPGYFISLEEDKVRIANDSDTFILGVTSSSPGILTGSTDYFWPHKYVLDEWGNRLFEEGKVTRNNTEYTERIPIINKFYDEQRRYKKRQERPEWVAVSTMGRLLVRDDGTCLPGGFCQPNEQGVATPSSLGYPVLKRQNDNKIVIYFFPWI